MFGDQAKGLVSFIENGVKKRKEKGKKKIILQLCEKYIVLNMKVKVRRVGKYNKEKVRKLINQI